MYCHCLNDSIYCGAKQRPRKNRRANILLVIITNHEGTYPHQLISWQKHLIVSRLLVQNGCIPNFPRSKRIQLRNLLLNRGIETWWFWLPVRKHFRRALLLSTTITHSIEVSCYKDWFTRYLESFWFMLKKTENSD